MAFPDAELAGVRIHDEQFVGAVAIVELDLVEHLEWTVAFREDLDCEPGPPAVLPLAI